jgi:hypothetical protein
MGPGMSADSASGGSAGRPTLDMYPVNKLCYRIVQEPELREALATDPETAIRAARPPLAEEHVAALLAGDVGTLSRAGANHFLLHQLGRFKLLGLDLPAYAERIRAEWAVERAGKVHL